MDDFTQYQLKEYENISQAHFKTNEVLATFYRYFLLITAIPITTIGIAVMNISDDGIGPEARALGQYIFGISALLLSIVGAAVISYIEGLRLDAILYARVVNSIRDYFFKKPGNEEFGPSVLPRERNRPSYAGFGAGFIIYFACAIMNSAYFSAGVIVLTTDLAVPLTAVALSKAQLVAAVVFFLALMIIQTMVRCRLISDKASKGF